MLPDDTPRSGVSAIMTYLPSDDSPAGSVPAHIVQESSAMKSANLEQKAGLESAKGIIGELRQALDSANAYIAAHKAKEVSKANNEHGSLHVETLSQDVTSLTKQHSLNPRQDSENSSVGQLSHSPSEQDAQKGCNDMETQDESTSAPLTPNAKHTNVEHNTNKLKGTSLLEKVASNQEKNAPLHSGVVAEQNDVLGSQTRWTLIDVLSAHFLAGQLLANPLTAGAAAQAVMSGSIEPLMPYLSVIFSRSKRLSDILGDSQAQILRENYGNLAGSLLDDSVVKALNNITPRTANTSGKKLKQTSRKFARVYDSVRQPSVSELKFGSAANSLNRLRKRGATAADSLKHAEVRQFYPSLVKADVLNNQDLVEDSEDNTYSNICHSTQQPSANPKKPSLSKKNNLWGLKESEGMRAHPKKRARSGFESAHEACGSQDVIRQDGLQHKKKQRITPESAEVSPEPHDDKLKNLADLANDCLLDVLREGTPKNEFSWGARQFAVRKCKPCASLDSSWRTILNALLEPPTSMLKQTESVKSEGMPAEQDDQSGDTGSPVEEEGVKQTASACTVQAEKDSEKIGSSMRCQTRSRRKAAPMRAAL